MIRVDFDELGFSDDGYGDLTYEGDAFTGIATETSIHGHLLSQCCYRLGKRHGPSLDWDENGTLRRERYHYVGSPTGPLREWNEQGHLRLEEIWELRILLWRRRWDENGMLVEDASQLNPNRVRTWVEKRSRSTPILIVLEGDEFVDRPWPYDGLVPSEVHAQVTQQKRPEE
jgi:hypothetical protein